MDIYSPVDGSWMHDFHIQNFGNMVAEIAAANSALDFDSLLVKQVLLRRARPKNNLAMWDMTRSKYNNLRIAVTVKFIMFIPTPAWSLMRELIRPLNWVGLVKSLLPILNFLIIILEKFWTISYRLLKF